MFVDFNKVFTEKRKHIPVPVLEYYSQQLPGNLHYEEVAPGTAVLAGFRKIEDLSPVITDNMKKVIGDKATWENILQYSYNTQTPVEFKSKVEGQYTIDGNSVSIQKMIKEYGQQVAFSEGSFFVKPQPFPNPVEIVISCEDCSKKIHFQQKPFNSITTSKYSIIDFDVLQIDIFINKAEANKCKIYIRLHTDHAKNTTELVEALKLYNAFVTGKGVLGGTILQEGSFASGQECPKELIVFWEKVSRIEEKGNYHFVPDISKSISMKEAVEVEKLFQNIVLKQPTLDWRKVDTITIEPNGKDIEHIKENGKLGNSAFLYMVEDKYSLLGEELALPTIVCVYNVFYTVRQNKNNLIVQFIDDKKTYSVSRCFVNSKDVDSYLENNPNCINDFLNYVDVKSLVVGE